ncbi:MAG: UDP-3-O-acyl-N-acetylglucosamine deacetylase [Thermoanaerobaculales bacterium]
MKPLVLIVDDEPGILTELANILKDEGFATLTTASGDEALELYRRRRPAAVFLDVWLPDRDGIETLRVMREIDPAAAVIMISGHGDAPTAVTSIKLGAYDYLEKPLAYNRVVEALRGALSTARAHGRGRGAPTAKAIPGAEELPRTFHPPRALSLLREALVPQRTIRSSTVIYGLGLHSGSRTGMVIQPLPPNSGIHFVTLPKGTAVPAHLSAVAETEYATTLAREGEEIRTVEHFLSTLHAAGITNLLIKVRGEIPVLDGSALEFCQRLEEVGIQDQDAMRLELVIDRRYEVVSGAKSMIIEPADVFSVAYQLRYPPPIGEQSYEFVLRDFASYREEIAPARTFGFLRDVPMMNELGLGSGGRLDNFILVGEDNVINTELRFPDEFVRHKILDIIGDLFLLGYPVRGKVTARFTGHRDNVALQRAILAACT